MYKNHTNRLLPALLFLFSFVGEACTAEPIPDKLWSHYTWHNGEAFPRMISVNEGFGLLIEVGGHFGGSEQIVLNRSKDAPMFWQLTGKSKAGKTNGRAIAVKWPEWLERSFEIRRWTKAQGKKPMQLIHRDEGICFLTGIGGAFNGNGESVRLAINPKDGFWYLRGSSLAPNTQVLAIVIKYRKDVKQRPILEFFEWERGKPLAKMIPADEGICALMGIRGDLYGASSFVRIGVRDNQWFLNGTSGRPALKAWAMAVRYPQPPGKIDLAKRKLLGKWKIVYFEAGGRKLPVEENKILTFTENEFHGLLPDVSYRIDPVKSPLHLDLINKKNPKEVFPLIYKVTGDTFSFVMHMVEDDEQPRRPDNFNTKGKPFALFRARRINE